jgi:hypothetical protein
MLAILTEIVYLYIQWTIATVAAKPQVGGAIYLVFLLFLLT